MKYIRIAIEEFTHIEPFIKILLKFIKMSYRHFLLQVSQPCLENGTKEILLGTQDRS